MTKKRSTDIRTCPVCGHTVQRSDMQFTRDCNGIPFRLVCWDCYDQLMAKAMTGNITQKQMKILIMTIKKVKKCTFYRRTKHGFITCPVT